MHQQFKPADVGGLFRFPLPSQVLFARTAGPAPGIVKDPGCRGVWRISLAGNR